MKNLNHETIMKKKSYCDNGENLKCCTLSVTQALNKNSFFLQILPLHYVSALVGRRFSYHPT